MGECKGREGTAAEHCWHHSGLVLSSMPGIDVYYCCFCGAQKDVRQRPMGDSKEHGPHRGIWS